ncbi:hypothetical protein [Xylocopilactobacillus apicola]|uniref:DUF5068 domain-containing protein n=1 Tax=Xylocopilactobacillus apicola TaxID=2932184 RepID=A0AAU9DSX5_9LACO|nr:hypothetical protein [Xylocopilactobacillus apicola]BDR58418.1 hypothetical protein XA3_08590 [Xylocopilactobacillus apicola]
MSVNKSKVVISSPKKKNEPTNFFAGKTYSAVYKVISKSEKDPIVTHNVTIYFKSDGTMIEKDEQINSNQKTTSQVPNKITVYSATTELNGNIVQSKTSSLVEAKYNSQKQLKANLPYDVRARGQAFNYPLRDSDPKQFLFSINDGELIGIMSDGNIVKLVKSTQRLDSLKNYAKNFGKQRDRNDLANQEAKDNSDSSQNQLVQTQENSDGVYFMFGYFSSDNDSQYTVDLKISNPTNKTQYVTLDQIIFQSSSNKYIPNANYKGQIEISAFSSKYFPAFFNQLKYDDVFGQFSIYYSTDTNPIINHNNKGKFPSNFTEGQLENSGL